MTQWDNASPWTEERVEQLKKLWDDGLSCSQIAAELGGSFSRNAIIGKVDRLGLPPRTRKMVAREKKQRDWKADYARRRAKLAFEPRLTPGLPARPLIDAPPSRRLSLQEVHDGVCRYATDEPSFASHLFCGQRTLGSPYCPFHHAVVYVPPMARQPRKAA